MRVPAILAALLAVVVPAKAATFATERLADGRVALHMLGVIERGDEARFSDALHRKPVPVLLLLGSPGGDPWSSMEIGRRNTLPTQVRSGETCASGCATIWVSGRERYVEPGAQIGFHGPSKTVDGHEVEVGWADAQIGAYYARLGFSDAAIYRMTSAVSPAMYWIDDTDAANGIAFAPRPPTTGKPIGSTPDATPKIARQTQPGFFGWLFDGPNTAHLTSEEGLALATVIQRRPSPVASRPTAAATPAD